MELVITQIYLKHDVKVFALVECQKIIVMYFCCRTVFQTTDKGPVLDALTKALVHLYPHPRYQPMELYFKLSVWVNTHLPEWVFEVFFT
jgi:hypothetical protein